MGVPKIRVGVIGLGRSGRDIHSEALMKMPERYTIVAVTDGVAERRNRAVRDYGCTSYRDYREMIERRDLDLIVNATPSQLHVPISMELLNAGYNVLCEKPLASHTEEVHQLIAASKKAGKLLAVFHNYRYNPIYLEILKVIESEVLGRIVQISISVNEFSRRWDWQTLKSNNGGNLRNTGAHYLDLALRLMGAEGVPNVLCHMDLTNSFGDADDYCKLVLKEIGKPLVDLEISSCSTYPGPMCVIQGKNGGLIATKTKVEWKYFKQAEAPPRKLEEQPISDENGLPIYCREQLTWHESAWEFGRGTDYPQPDIAFYSMLYDSLTKGKPLAITPEQVLQLIAVTEECFLQNPKFQP